MAIRIDVSRFEMINSASPRLSDNKPCAAGIDGVKVKKFTYDMGGATTEFPKVAGGPDVNDPVGWLVKQGWKPSRRVGTGTGPREDDESMQAAAFEQVGEFESLHVEYVAPAHCDCGKGDAKKSKKRTFKWTVDYDRSSNEAPKTKLVEVDDNGNPLEPQDEQLKPTAKQTESHAGDTTTYEVTEESTADIPCPCDKDSPCQVHFILKFTYTTSVVAD